MEWHDKLPPGVTVERENTGLLRVWVKTGGIHMSYYSASPVCIQTTDASGRVTGETYIHAENGHLSSEHYDKGYADGYIDGYGDGTNPVHCTCCGSMIYDNGVCETCLEKTLKEETEKEYDEGYLAGGIDGRRETTRIQEAGQELIRLLEERSSGEWAVKVAIDAWNLSLE